MSPNLGAVDRAVRVVLGLVLLSLIFWGPQTWWGLIGLVPIATAIWSFCPLYKAFGWSTAGRGPKAAHS